MPDVSVHFKVDPQRDELLLLACDGLWSRLSTDVAARYLRERLWCHDEFARSPDASSIDSVFVERHWSAARTVRQLVDDSVQRHGAYR